MQVHIMKKLVVATPAALLMSAAVAYAIPTTTNFTGSATLSYAPTGGPSQTGKFPGLSPNPVAINQTLTTGNPATTFATFFTVSPSGGFALPSNNIVFGDITVKFNLKDGPGNAAFSEIGHYDANYNGKGGAGSDDVWWGPCTQATAVTCTDTVNAAFSDGAVLAITFKGATDWNITPQIQYQYTNAPHPGTSVPEPPALALLGIALLGFGLTRRRRKGA